MRPFLAGAVATALAGLLAAGCFEGKAEVALNPDGTGKIVGELAFAPGEPWVRPPRGDAATQLVDPETQMKEIVTSILKRSRGIEAWKDVAFKRLDDGRIQFKGTAYFKDLAEVQIWPDDAKARAAFGPEGEGVRMLVLYRPTGEADDSRRPGRSWSAERLAARMKSMRLDYREYVGAVGTRTAGLRLDLGFLVPGIPDEVKGLEQRGRALAFATTGAELMRYLDGLVADNTWLRDMAMSGKSLNERTLEELVNEGVFAQKKEVWARLTGRFLPRFNYAEELAAAKAAEKDMLVKLGLEEPRATRSYRPPTRPGPGDAPPADPPPSTPPKKPSPPDDKMPRIPMPKDPPSIPAPIFPF